MTKKVVFATIFVLTLLISSSSATLTSGANESIDSRQMHSSNLNIPSSIKDNSTRLSINSANAMPPNIGPSTVITSSYTTNAVLISPTTRNSFVSAMPNDDQCGTRFAQGVDSQGNLIFSNSSHGGAMLDVDLGNQNRWWLHSFWGYDSLNDYMHGTLVAVDNTISNLNSTTGSSGYPDQIMIEPINMAYGEPGPFGHFVWFQFVIYFFAEGGIGWSIWNNTDTSVYCSHTITNAECKYVPGDEYSFSLQPTGTNTITFHLQDLTNSSNGPFNYPMYAPGTLIRNGAVFYSPTCSVEALTHSSISALTDVPYFQCLIEFGDGLQNKVRSGNPPRGIDTAVWQTDSDLYWSICGTNYIESITGGYGVGYGIYGNGGVSNPPSALTGSKDGNYAYEYGGNYGDGAWIRGQMNAPSGGAIYVRCYSTPGYYSNLYTYVSNDGQSWIQIGTYKTIPITSAVWVCVGTYLGDFNYIAVVGYDSGNSVYLHLDAVTVGADPPVTVLAYDESTSSYVSGIPISIDGNWVSSGDVINLSSVDYMFQAPDATGGGAFDCFYDGTSYYSNPADIWINGETTITAYYHYIPTYTVYFSAIDYTYWIPLYPNAYIDSNYVGTCPTSVQVPLGWHSITYDWQIWNEYTQSYDNIWCIGIGSDWPSNGATIPIVADTNTCGIYMPS